MSLRAARLASSFFVISALAAGTAHATLIWESDPSRIKRFPEQLVLSAQRNVMGYFDEHADPARTCFPAGQGVGAFREIKPAGDVLREMVTQAERILATGVFASR